ncbi:protein precursor [Thermoascus aurantiacus ATCC 26904]
MGYYLYFLTLFVLVCGTALYLTRSRWIPLVPVPDYLYHRLPSSFAGDIEAGFTSSDFDLSANVAEGDSRAGLDQRAKRAIQKIMKSRGVGFDEARRIYTEQRFAKNNIGPDGRPRDPKFVSFS